MSHARASLAYLHDMSRDSLRGFAHLGLLMTLLQSFLIRWSRRTPNVEQDLIPSIIRPEIRVVLQEAAPRLSEGHLHGSSTE